MPSAAVLCCECKFYKVPGSQKDCSRWRYGYEFRDPPEPDSITVEDDEGWGARIGPYFGCVLGEQKE